MQNNFEEAKRVVLDRATTDKELGTLSDEGFERGKQQLEAFIELLDSKVATGDITPQIASDLCRSLIIADTLKVA